MKRKWPAAVARPRVATRAEFDRMPFNERLEVVLYSYANQEGVANADLAAALTAAAVHLFFHAGVAEEKVLKVLEDTVRHMYKVGCQDVAEAEQVPGKEGNA